jgi:hypothetical protein
MVSRSLIRSASFLAIAVACSACAEVQTAYRGMKDREEMGYIAQARQSCARYGFKPDTDAFAQCVSNNVNSAKDRDALEQMKTINGSK